MNPSERLMPSDASSIKLFYSIKFEFALYWLWEELVTWGKKGFSVDQLPACLQS